MGVSVSVFDVVYVCCMFSVSCSVRGHDWRAVMYVCPVYGDTFVCSKRPFTNVYNDILFFTVIPLRAWREAYAHVRVAMA